MSEPRQSDISRVQSDITSDKLAEPVSIRVSPHSYLAALLIGSYASSLAFYLEYDVVGIALFGLSWILLPFLAVRDQIIFDGRSLTRSGLLPRFWTWFNGDRRRLKISDVEQVETQAVRALKRGGNIYYRYRTTLRGKGLSITIASGGEHYRRMLESVLPQLPENSLDVRSAELREHLKDPKETLMRAEFARIPSADVLRSDFLRNSKPLTVTDPQSEDPHADELHELANELRAGGYLPQALEAFRRALRHKPRDGRLLFEFARCLHSFAAVEKSPQLERKALASLRLSERRSQGDPELLVRLGEFYFQVGEWRRAGNVFQGVIDKIGDHFLAARGMAEIALREGKIAHVIHQFAAAGRAAGTPALRRWARTEAEYFSKLSSDDEYMEMEISRVNLLDGLERSKRTALRIASIAFPAVIAGLLFDDEMITTIGWTVSTVALFIWAALVISAKMFASRIPYHLVNDED